MQFTDRPGYDTLREYFPRLSGGLSDASVLGGKLLAADLISDHTRQAALAHPVLADRITGLLEGVMRQGSSGAFQRFVEIIKDDAPTVELAGQLKDSYLKRKGVWKNSGDDATGQNCSRAL